MIRLIKAAAAALLPAACATSAPNTSSPAAVPSTGVSERLTGDTPKTTVSGNTFIAPAGWAISVRGPATILEPPEGGSAIALVDVRAPSADSAVAAGWRAYKPDAAWPLKVVNERPDKDGWTDRAGYTYQTSPNEKRDVGVDVQRANGVWTVAIYDMALAVGEKRLGQIARRETFAGRKAHRLDRRRIAELGDLDREGHDGRQREPGPGAEPAGGIPQVGDELLDHVFPAVPHDLLPRAGHAPRARAAPRAWPLQPRGRAMCSWALSSSQCSTSSAASRWTASRWVSPRMPWRT